MFGYFWVTMSATCSQAFFSTSEPDHMNQVSVTGPPDEPDEPPELPELPPQAASKTAANATVRILVSRDSRMPLLTQDVVVHADRVAGQERVPHTRGDLLGLIFILATAPVKSG